MHEKPMHAKLLASACNFACKVEYMNQANYDKCNYLELLLDFRVQDLHILLTYPGYNFSFVLESVKLELKLFFKKREKYVYFQQ